MLLLYILDATILVGIALICLSVLELVKPQPSWPVFESVAIWIYLHIFGCVTRHIGALLFALLSLPLRIQGLGSTKCETAKACSTKCSN